ncbi:MgtC/SapB family protein [Citrobacter sp. Cpo142]|jgi:putative Mg2+ transporter-C (MgtC) family protein|uniref:MgtC/SapB family protein n=1 Tax=Citrobacter TaxID=544 RepID=UPI000F44B228|nr:MULTISPECIES: MgtC/SapB family protein [Citrobacter]EIP1106062.1 MgtC/SapB family protein [Citrobacter freundii]MBD0808326.1 MgtC/SapB family protein [Citrobacter sp. C13]RNL75074.1 MgtC/SapB family protein [Citrobacter sp. MH181794]KAA0538267.1 MgtC/SapB family protein [Citrobacter portucalensis]KAA0539299.1 MgtC/SapB family protein [Citrobacter portucalensis]
MNNLAAIINEQGLLPLTTIIKISIAFILGGIIGLERESKGKPVGFKTCVILSVASCVLTVVSIQSAEYYAEISMNIRSDPMRLAAQIISGVGFLGAGVILHRHDDAISGLTTAAIVWASAGVGITCGAGFYFHAVFATALFLLAIKLSPFIIFLQTRNQFPGKVKVRVILDERDALESLITRIHQQKNIIENITIRDIKKGKIEVNLKIVIRQKMTLPDLYHDLTHVDHVCAIALEH